MSASGRLVRGLRRRGLRGTVQLVRLALWSVLIEVGLRVAPLPRLVRFVGVTLGDGPAADGPAQGGASLPEEASPPGTTLPLTAVERQGVLDAHRILRRGPFADTCLRRALLVGHVLRPYAPVLHIGVAKSDGRVTAHAWLVADGVNLDPTGSARFTAVVPTMKGTLTG
ncbi:lasso peptide biosynthesis B2 protein [Pengzhenrongella frigida]|uniref:lasso peptide biosynthesis B2 protein n=1 Tax=Pengzhenrongella frigida TaxID=1259133 RepID=UPI0013ED7EFD|nr:lasso peptide biosynthesis B2 protein [Cellulomonas sp. HLT2-17]